MGCVGVSGGVRRTVDSSIRGVTVFTAAWQWETGKGGALSHDCRQRCQLPVDQEVWSVRCFGNRDVTTQDGYIPFI